MRRLTARLPAYSKRFAPPRALLSNNPLLAVLGVVFLVGALLLALGTFMVRREAKAQAFVTELDDRDIVQGDVFDAISAFAPSEPRVIPSLSRDELDLRLDQIDRLMIVGQPWCVEELERDFLNDADERVSGAARDALLVIRSRG